MLCLLTIKLDARPNICGLQYFSSKILLNFNVLMTSLMNN